MKPQEAAAKALVAKFRTIAMERLRKLNDAFLALEQNPDNQPLVQEALREIHTLKGESRIMRFADIGTIAHHTEGLLIGAKDLGFRVDEDFSRLTLTGFDLMTTLLSEDPAEGEAGPDVEAFVAAVNLALAHARAPEKTNERPKTLAASQGGPEQNGFRERALKELIGTREVDSIRVDLDRLNELTELLGDVVRRESGTESSFDGLARSAEDWGQQLQNLRRRLGRYRHAQAVTYDELVEFVDAIKGMLQGQELLYGDLRAALKIVHENTFQNRVSLEELEQCVKDLRLLPLSALFRRYPRAVRDLCADQGKKARVVLRGADVEVDKQVLDQIGEPLLHLIRNAVDHGLETMEERRAAGKGEAGTITLEARQSGAMVQIIVSDDGRGIDADRIQEVAKQRGLLGDGQGAELDRDTLMGLIFTAGFTTRSHATDVSGRGVGLDVVREGLHSLGGNVRVQSTFERGTSFCLNVPISVAMMSAMIIELGGHRYAVPTDGITITDELGADAIESAGAGRAFRIDGALIPIVELATLLGMKAQTSSNETPRPFVVIENQDRRLGLFVGAVLGERQLVQKAMDGFFAGLPLYQGTAQLESGELVLVLNVPQLMQAAGEEPVWRVSVLEEETARKQPSVLLVDDSELTRDMLVEIMKRRGYQVIEAVNGKEALDRVAAQVPDIIVTDLEMPIIDGFELLQQLKGKAETKDVPVVVFSTRGAEADIQRGMDLGADAYLVKTAFQEEEMAQTLDRLLPHAPA